MVAEMRMTPEQWLKIADLMKGDIESVKIGLSMINSFSMTGNRAAVVTLAIILEDHIGNNKGTVRDMWATYCKNWYWFLYRVNSTLAGMHSPHREGKGKSNSYVLIAWINQPKRTPDEKEWIGFYKKWIEDTDKGGFLP